MFTLTLSRLVWEPRRKLIAHQCCDQLTAVKTGYPLTSITWPYRGLKCRPIEVEYFFEVIRWQITSFKWSQAQVYFFQWFIWNMLCLCHYGPALLRFWFQTDLGRENSASFLKIQAGKTFSYHGHALVTLYVQFLCSDWSKFDRWVHAENLCSILKVVYFDSLRWSWQSFVSTCVMFLTVFFHWMYKMKYSCYQESSVIHGWFVYWVFGWEMRRLSKFGNPISDGIVFVFHLAWCVRGFKSLKQLWPSLIVFRNWISNGKPE